MVPGAGQQLGEARRQDSGAEERDVGRGMDERGSSDSDGGAPVTATVNFDSLTAYYAKSNAF
jgi:hypothetical protein